MTDAMPPYIISVITKGSATDLWVGGQTTKKRPQIQALPLLCTPKFWKVGGDLSPHPPGGAAHGYDHLRACTTEIIVPCSIIYLYSLDGNISMQL